MKHSIFKSKIIYTCLFLAITSVFADQLAFNFAPLLALYESYFYIQYRGLTNCSKDIDLGTNTRFTGLNICDVNYDQGQSGGSAGFILDIGTTNHPLVQIGYQSYWPLNAKNPTTSYEFFPKTTYKWNR